MAKDEADDIEWRLVATKGRESCRWQTSDGRWISLALGAQGDLTKVLVSGSDGRSEVVDGYEQGLNLARRWRTGWQKPHEPTSSSQSGSWLPPLPGRGGSYEDISSPDVAPLRQNSASPNTGSRSRPSVPHTTQSPPTQSSPSASGSFPSRTSLNRVSPVSRGSSTNSNPASSSGNVPSVGGDRSSMSPSSRDSRRRLSGSVPAIRLTDERPSNEPEPRPSSTSNPKR